MDQVVEGVRESVSQMSTWITSLCLQLMDGVDEDPKSLLLPSHLMIAVILLLVLLSVIVSSVLLFRKYKTKVRETILPDPTKPRFRKRDKVLFYGRQMLRKVRSSLLIQQPGSKSNPRKGRKRQMVLRFAKRLLRLRKEQPLSLLVKEPSQAFLEEASADQRDTGLPKEVPPVI